MFDVAGGVRCREDVAQRRGYSDRSNAASVLTERFALGGKRHWRAASAWQAERLVLS